MKLLVVNCSLYFSCNEKFRGSITVAWIYSKMETNLFDINQQIWLLFTFIESDIARNNIRKETQHFGQSINIQWEKKSFACQTSVIILFYDLVLTIISIFISKHFLSKSYTWWNILSSISSVQSYDKKLGDLTMYI